MPESNDLFSQHARLITLETAQATGQPDTLVAESFTGFEAVNELFWFDIDALSVSAQIDLDTFIGEQITLRLLQADGSHRAWHGYCTQATWLGADGGRVRYRLRLEPFLAFLGLRHDAYIFQDKDARQIITELMADYPQANFAWDATQTLAERAICTQYRETDLDFFTRLLASEGLSWRFEHEQKETGGDANSSGHARHKLIIFDSQTALPDMPGGVNLRFHGLRASDSQDAIREFSAARQPQSNAVAVSSWHPGQLVAPAASLGSSLAQGELPVLERYVTNTERRYADADAADRHSRLALKALELDNKNFLGQGAVRQLAAGCSFNLSQHQHYPEGDNQFTVLAVKHSASNNLGTGIVPLLPTNLLERGTYRNQFSCVRQSVALVPPLTALRQAATALGNQTALVVGLPQAPLTTERDHRIKIQFPWQRGQQPHAGGLSETGSSADTTGNAPGDDTSGTWVRVAEALAGPNWGSVFTPRIGSEVLVGFIENDIDRPVIVASLYNGSDTPPFAAGVDSGVNHAGHLSGMHSHNLEDGGYNQWVLDDSPDQLRMRLASATAASQLNLGYLVSQAPSSAQRGAYRGHGFELRSDAWGMVRGGEGLLLTSTARNRQGASVQSTQLDSAESLAQLNAAASLNGRLSQAAQQQQAIVSGQASLAQQQRIQAMDPQQQGKYPAEVNGQPAASASPGGREADPGRPVARYGVPLVNLDSPASMNWASPAASTVFSGQHLHWSTQADSHWAAGHTFAAATGNASSLFSLQGGIKAIAANGPVSVQAHTGALEILADQAITITSVNNRIDLKANSQITLQAGQTTITLNGGNITFTCPGQFSAKGGQHPFSGGQ
ncbi:MAG: type VI secretion system Vgr family protein [Methylococcaceae bacterium]|jgi:type VI secretion system secreted protein VgrG